MEFSKTPQRSQNQDALKGILFPVQQELLALEEAIFGLLDSQIPFVRTVGEHILKNGGKRIRPILTIVCAKMTGFQGNRAAQVGACVEFLHTASLLHDDVIDNAKVRRGKTSANALWGNHVSVLVGDFFYSRASQLLIEQGNTRILKVLADCTIATTEGEIWETLKSSDLDTNRDDYINIIKLKTAFLFQAACQVGGILGGVSDCFVKALSDYGLHLGMAFQLVDDILDYNASEDVFGKSQGIDLREGKLTLPLILSLGRAAPDEKQVIKNAVLADKIDQELFERVRQIIRKYHGFEDTLGLAVEHIAQAKQSLDPFRESLEKGILASLADYVINRER